MNFSAEARAGQAEAAVDALGGAPVADAEPVAIDAAPAPLAGEAEDGDGPAAEAAVVVEEEAPLDQHGSAPLRLGDRRVEILEAWTEDDEGVRSDVVRTGRPAAVCFRVAVNEPVSDPLFGINIYDSQNNNMFAANNVYDEQVGDLVAGSEHVVRITFENFLAPDRYWITAAVAKDRHGLQWHDRRHRMIAFVVTGTRPRDGMVSLPFTLELQPVAEREEVGR